MLQAAEDMDLDLDMDFSKSKKKKKKKKDIEELVAANEDAENEEPGTCCPAPLPPLFPPSRLQLDVALTP